MRAKMHHDEVDTSEALVRRLVGAQFPQWADMAITPVVSTGTCNAMYRLGDDMVVRLPLRPSEAGSVRKEHRWSALLASQLPLPIPVPLGRGVETDEYPLPWTVAPWFPGEDGITATVDLTEAARATAHFMIALQAIDPTGGPTPDPATYGRGVPLSTRDGFTRSGIESAAHLVDTKAVTRVWETSLAATPWEHPAVWAHGDLAAGNLLFENGHLSAVIDFAAFGIGDPACDLIIAWEMFDAASREEFRSELAVDDATWERGRGWALSTAITAWPYYEHTNQFMADQARRKIEDLLATAT